MVFFFFKQKTAYEMRISDWSSDVGSSDLAISKRIVELMSGRIGVESEPGRGATFWFEAPLLKVQGDMPATAISANSGGRLLLLSADPRLRLRLSMLLPNWGLRVSSVETTPEALDRMRTAANLGKPWAYSVVLADLPGIRTTAVALPRTISQTGRASCRERGCQSVKIP